jgi:selenide,water dikinase
MSTDLAESTADDPFADLRLTEWTSCGGCAAKWGAALLSDLVRDMPAGSDPSPLVGLAPFDDAAVYQVAPDVALVSTTDFFPPLVDHPADFGAIAAANACSDVFAMGGRVAVAVNVAAFPEHFPREAIVAIFEAAAATVTAAGGTVAGGHTIRNPEPIFGLAVQGVVHPERVFRKAGARVGDALVLGKPLGTGVVLAGASPADRRVATDGMRRLNRGASEALQAHHGAVRAVTDVTGYGLYGHGWEMAERSGGAFRIELDRLPTYPGAADALRAGVRTGGDPRNRDHVERHVHLDAAVDRDVAAIGYDPQTSGGLLAAVDAAIVDDLAASGFVRIGTVVEADPARGPGITVV